MGKTTLANMLINDDCETWRRLDLRGLEPDQIAGRLSFATQMISDSQVELNCVIDDLNFDNQVSAYEIKLARFIYLIKLRHGRVIITTQGTLPSVIVTQYDIPPVSFVDAPSLTEEEIAELAINYNCPHEMAGGWTRLILAHSKGHPLLAHAEVRSLESRGWPQPETRDFFTSSGADDIRQEFRRRLNELLPSTEARSLLYRLSIFGSRFKRHQATYMSGIEPKIT